MHRDHPRSDPAALKKGNHDSTSYNNLIEGNKEVQENTKKIHWRINIWILWILTMFIIHPVLTPPSQQRYSHTIQQGGMTIHKIEVPKVYCETRVLFSSTESHIINKYISKLVRSNVTNKSPEESNTFLFYSSNIGLHVSVNKQYPSKNWKKLD